MIVYREVATGNKVGFADIRAKYQTAPLYSDADFARLGYARRDVVEVPSGASGYQTATEGVETLVNGVWTQVWLVTDKALPELSAMFEVAVQGFLNAGAEAKGYGSDRSESIVSACSYAGAANPFQTEGAAFVTWRGVVWQQCFTDLTAISLGQMAMPASVAAYLTTLPPSP